MPEPLPSPDDPTVPTAPSSEPLPANRRRFRPARLALAAAFTAALLAGCATLDQRQREWIFQPRAESWSGGVHAAQGMQEVWIPFTSAETGEPVRLHGLWHPQARKDAPLLLYLHGARWDVTGSAPRILRMQELGFSVLAIDYRGFGKTEPRTLPSEAMAYEDAQAAWQWLGTQHPDVPRYIFGHSLGAAIAVDLAARTSDEAGLIVEGGFPSIRELVSTMRWGWLPVGPLITQRFEAGEKIARVGSPLLVVHGSEDRLIPPALGQALYDGARDPKHWVLVEGGSHHNTNARGQGAYREALRTLFGLGI